MISRRESYICGYWHYALARHARNPLKNASETLETPSPQEATVEDGLERGAVLRYAPSYFFLAVSQSPDYKVAGLSNLFRRGRRVTGACPSHHECCIAIEAAG